METLSGVQGTPVSLDALALGYCYTTWRKQSVNRENMHSNDHLGTRVVVFVNAVTKPGHLSFPASRKDLFRQLN